MSTQKILGYVLVIIGGYFALQAAMGAYGLLVGPSAPSIGAFIIGLILIVGIPGGLAWLLITYGKKWIA